VLERLQQIARWLCPLLPVAVLIVIGGMALFLWAAAGGVPVTAADDDGPLILGLIASLWGALLFALITGFRDVPPPIDPALSWFRRLKAHLTRGAYLLMAWAMPAAAIMAVMVTYRLVVLWVD
jgi:hypothetical protein